MIVRFRTIGVCLLYLKEEENTIVLVKYLTERFIVYDTFGITSRDDLWFLTTFRDDIETADPQRLNARMGCDSILSDEFLAVKTLDNPCE